MALSASKLSKAFGSLAAVDAVSLDLEPGEIHAVIGENGAGKTTLMRMLAGLIVADAGTISIGGRELRRGDARQARRLGVGMVHQHFALVPTMTVAENMLLAEPGAVLDRG